MKSFLKLRAMRPKASPHAGHPPHGGPHAPSATTTRAVVTEEQRILDDGVKEIEAIEKRGKVAIADANSEGAEKMAQARVNGEVKIAQAKVDAEVARTQAQSKRDIKQMEKEFAKQDRNWVQRHPVLTGLGAMGAGGLAYNVAGPSGTSVSTISPEEAGAQAALMEAANLNAAPMAMVNAGQLAYDGPMQDQSRQASI